MSRYLTALLTILVLFESKVSTADVSFDDNSSRSISFEDAVGASATLEVNPGKLTAYAKVEISGVYSYVSIGSSFIQIFVNDL